MVPVLKLFAGLSAGLILMGCAFLAHLQQFAHWRLRLEGLFQEPAFTIATVLALGWIPPLLCEIVCFSLGIFIICWTVRHFIEASSNATHTI
jgi:hypothetical protein